MNNVQYMQYRIKILSTQCEKGTVIVSSTLVYEYTKKIGLGGRKEKEWEPRI